MLKTSYKIELTTCISLYNIDLKEKFGSVQEVSGFTVQLYSADYLVLLQ